MTAQVATNSNSSTMMMIHEPAPMRADIVVSVAVRSSLPVRFVTPTCSSTPAFSSLSRMGCPARGAVRRLRTVGGIGVVLGYSRDEPAGGERLQVCLHRVSNIVGIDLRSSALGIDWRYHRVRAAQVFVMKASRS